jgi:hypothetical protein
LGRQPKGVTPFGCLPNPSMRVAVAARIARRYRHDALFQRDIRRT